MSALPVAIAEVTTTGGFLPVLALGLPLLGVLAALVLGAVSFTHLPAPESLLHLVFRLLL